MHCYRCSLSTSDSSEEEEEEEEEGGGIPGKEVRDRGREGGQEDNNKKRHEEAEGLCGGRENQGDE